MVRTYALTAAFCPALVLSFPLSRDLNRRRLNLHPFHAPEPLPHLALHVQPPADGDDEFIMHVAKLPLLQARLQIITTAYSDLIQPSREFRAGQIDLLQEEIVFPSRFRCQVVLNADGVDFLLD